jgi:hypothetical protein
MDVKGNFPKKMLQKAKFRALHFDDEFRFKERIIDPVTKKVRAHSLSLTHSFSLLSFPQNQIE